MAVRALSKLKLKICLGSLPLCISQWRWRTILMKMYVCLCKASNRTSNEALPMSPKGVKIEICFSARVNNLAKH